LLHAATELFAPSDNQVPDRQLSLGRRLLEHDQIAPWQLFYAMRRLSEWNASLAEILQAKGWITEAQLLPHYATHYFAQVVDLTQTPPDPRLSTQLSPEFCLKHAIIPWQRLNGQLVYVTSRPHGFAKLRPALPEGEVRARLVLATEEHIQSYLSEQFRPHLLQNSETRVAEQESCREWASHKHRRLLAFICVALPIALFFGLFPQLGLMALSSLILITQLMAISMKVAAFLGSQRFSPQKRKLASDKPLPKISVMVPLYRENNIANALVRRLSRLTYPKALLDIVLVLEEDDPLTRKALNHCKLPGWMRVIEVPKGSGLTTKPRAMNYALDFCKGDIIGIWDAEDAPAPDQLETVATHFAQAPANVACLQGILDYYNPHTNWLSRCFTLEYSLWFRTIIRGMSRLGAAVPLGGTTLFLRRNAIEHVGGWDSHNVTEDADLGIRLYRYGYRTELLRTVTQEEANCHFHAWIKQRSRWLKGYMMTYLVHMRRPLSLYQTLGVRRFLGFNAIFLSTLSQFLLAPFVWSFWLLALGASLNWINALPNSLVAGVALLFVGITCLDIGLAIASLRGQNRRWLAKWALTLPIYFTLATLGAYKALYELIAAPFYWDKTSHGQTKEGLEAQYSAFGDEF